MGPCNTRDLMGLGLAVLSKAAGSKTLDRLRLRTPVQRSVFPASRAGFRTLARTNRAFTARGIGRARSGRPPRHAAWHST
jgi:hypothetical protein